MSSFDELNVRVRLLGESSLANSVGGGGGEGTSEEVEPSSESSSFTHSFKSSSLLTRVKKVVSALCGVPYV